MTINLIVVKTLRPTALAAFYACLGIRFEYHQHGNGPLHYAAEINGIVFEIYPLPSGTTTDTTLRLGFTVDDLNKSIEKIKSFGAKIVKEPASGEWGYAAVIEDPDGRKIELTEKI